MNSEPLELLNWLLFLIRAGPFFPGLRARAARPYNQASPVNGLPPR